MSCPVEHIRRECMRHDTTVAAAFRRALGITAQPLPASRPKVRRRRRRGRYRAMRECFANEWGVEPDAGRW
ncbi:MAG: hypothetical protein SPG07_09225 [Coriobacteriales bacterium]|nr:hypothetical protein [Coriobacteriales bacterium]